MKILITNGRLAKRTGTEMYVYELAIELLARGHEPVVYSPAVGPLGELLRGKTVPVVQQVNRLAVTPDVIHGHHFEPLLCASLRYPRTPAIFCCHSWNSHQDRPPRLPSIQTYVAVDEACRDRLVYEFGVPEYCTQIVHNFVNLQRFHPRDDLPVRPSRALLFTNRTTIGRFPRALAAGCRDHGIQLDLLRAIAGKNCLEPEKVLPKYDVVFARGKAAIEAMAVGNAVILGDRRGLGPLVTSENFQRLRNLNFGRRAFNRPMRTAEVSRQLANYSAADASTVSRQIREQSPIDLIVDRWLELYAGAIESFTSPAPAAMEATMRAAAEHLEQLHPSLARGRRMEKWRAVFAKLVGLR